MPPQAMPPTLPGTTSVPRSDGGVKNPSARSARNRLAAPGAILVGSTPGVARASASVRRERARRRGKGCVGDATSPATSLSGHGALLDAE